MGKKHRLQGKVIKWIVLLSLIPMMVIGVFSTFLVRYKVSYLYRDFTKHIMEKTVYNMERNIEDVTLLCDEVLFIPSIQKGLNYAEYNIDIKRELVMETTEYFNSRYKLLRYLDEAEILNANGRIIFTTGYTWLSKKQLESMMEVADEGNGKIQWVNLTSRGNKKIAMVRELKSFEQKKSIGYLIIVLKKEFLGNLIIDLKLGQGSHVMIADRVEGFFIKSEEALLTKAEEKEVKSMVFMPSIDSEQVIKIDNKEYLITSTLLNEGRWALVSLTPTSNFHRESKIIIGNIFILSLVCVVLIIFFSFMISRKIWTPLKKLVSEIKKVEKGSLDVALQYYGEDEMGYLWEHFVKMMERIDQLVLENMKEQEQKHYLEIQMLQAQINPHFLFNALNSLGWTAKMNEAHSVSEGLRALAKILRSSIIQKGEFISIEEEIQNIEYYIVIQKLRYGDHFSVNYFIEEKLKKYQILKFLLQPIVENAIIHGGMDGSQPLIIEMTFKKLKDAISITVQDNGCGMSKKRCEDLLNRPSNKISGIGIQNVNQRLKLNFGEEYHLSIKSEVHQGTRIEMKIPCCETKTWANVDPSQKG